MTDLTRDERTFKHFDALGGGGLYQIISYASRPHYLDSFKNENNIPIKSVQADMGDGYYEIWNRNELELIKLWEELQPKLDLKHIDEREKRRKRMYQIEFLYIWNNIIDKNLFINYLKNSSSSSLTEE